MKKKRGGQKRKKIHLVFDEKEREDFLTGFRKRNVARKLKTKQELDKKVKAEMKKIKENQKEAFHQALTSQREVPEIQHLVEPPKTYNLPDHTVTISQIDNTDIPTSSSKGFDFPLAAGKTHDEIEKLRKIIKGLKANRIKAMQKSNIQYEVKQQQKKNDKQKAKKMKKTLQRSLKHMKKKNKNKHVNKS